MSGVLEIALEALEYHREQTRAIPKSDAAIAALKEAIKNQGEPVAWWNGERYGQQLEPIGEPSFSAKDGTWHDIPLYAGYNPTSAPTIPQGEPVGITDPLYGSGGGFTMAVFKAEDVPAGTKLYTLAPTRPVEQMELKRKADAVTAEDWRQVAEHYEYNWQTCSEGFNSKCGELRQQLAECQANLKAEVAYSNKTDVQLAESQAREKMLRGYLTPEQIKFGNVPSEGDSTALDSAIRQAVKEFAEELAAKFGKTDADFIHHMAEKLK